MAFRSSQAALFNCCLIFTILSAISALVAFSTTTEHGRAVWDYVKAKIRVPFSALKNNPDRPNMFYSPWELARQQRYSYNCPAIYAGDLAEVKRLKDQLKSDPYQQPTSGEVEKWASDCDMLRTLYNVRTHFINQEEYEFPIAFSIRMHKSVEQAEQLLRHVWAPQNVYCLYIDSKSNADIHSAMRQIVSCLPNVFIASKLKPFYYSTTSHVESDKQCMADSLNRSSTWKYFVNLVGEDFPIKTNLDLVHTLTILNGSNGIHSQLLNPKQADFRIHYVYKMIDGRNLRTNQRRKPFDNTTVYYKGAEYGLFSRAFVRWSLYDEYPKSLFEYLQGGTYASDEHYWATINRHPKAPGGYPFSADRYSKARLWVYSHKDKRRDTFPCRSRIVRSICIFGVSELFWLEEQPEPLANKFKLDMDPVATDCLGQKLTYQREKGIVNELSSLKFRPAVYDKVFYPK